MFLVREYCLLDNAIERQAMKNADKKSMSLVEELFIVVGEEAGW